MTQISERVDSGFYIQLALTAASTSVVDELFAVVLDELLSLYVWDSALMAVLYFNLNDEKNKIFIKESAAAFDVQR